jgi:uncharacterized protein
MIHGMPRPRVTPDSAPFWEACAQSTFLVPECEQGHKRWPPGPMCPDCQSMQTHWSAASGNGSLYSWVVVEHPTHPALNDQVPYVVALVDLDEGVRVVANLCDTPMADIHAGMALELFFEEADGIRLPNFRPRR